MDLAICSVVFLDIFYVLDYSSETFTWYINLPSSLHVLRNYFSYLFLLHYHMIYVIFVCYHNLMFDQFCSTPIKITNKMHYIDQFIIPSQLYMFRAMFSPIIRSTWLYLQYLVVFTQVAAGWCLECIETQFQRVQDTSQQLFGWTLQDTVNTVKCSWWWARTSCETCRADLE